MSVYTNSSSSSLEEIKAYTGALLDLLENRRPLDVLRGTEWSLRQAVEGLSEAQVGTPEGPGKWSVRHVLQHLADSELVLAFRFRMVLAHDRPPLIGYDQDLWANRLQYDVASVEESLEQFGVLRRANLRLMERTSPEDRKRVGVHAERGEESIEHMLRLVAGHDLLHLRQVDRILDAVA